LGLAHAFNHAVANAGVELMEQLLGGISSMKNTALRKEIDHLIASESVTAASAYLAQLWHEEAGPSAAGFVVSRYEQLRPHLHLITRRLCILRSFTVEPAVALLRAAAFVNGIDLTVQVGGFNAHAQEILDPTSRLYRYAPDIVILAVQTRDAAPDLWGRYADLSPAERNAAVERVVADFQTWIQAFRAHSQAYLIVHTLEIPPLLSQGVLDSQSETGQAAAIQRINQELCHIVGEYRGIYVLDYDALVSRHGRLRWHDERKWLTMRMPIAAENLVHWANEWLRFIHPLTDKIGKVLVADLDNTLWGGVLGEDGLEGIKLGPEYPGAAYQALQRAMLDLFQRGVLLAVCSKNNLPDAIEALERHPGMLLRPQHFAALRINWNDKVQNLYEIAAELNVGTDALAFMDDNPIERVRVRVEAPEVAVIDLPNDPMSYALALRDSPVFERLVLSAEDRERGQYYAEQRLRLEFERSATSLEDFYRSLQQEIEIAPVTAETLTRVAQLTQKTNQFNLTTRRYTEQQIVDMESSPDWKVYAVRVRDRFGDNGLVGVAITRDVHDVCEIDVLLLSCRVIGRTVETALLSFLVERAQSISMKQLQGWFLPTKKNEPAKQFYAGHNFRLLAERDGGTLWSVDLGQAEFKCPEWIRLTVAGGALDR
jgi:FkbH-like protein